MDFKKRRKKCLEINKRYPLNAEQYFLLMDTLGKYKDECWECWSEIAKILYYGGIEGGLTYDEIGIVMGFTRERIRQIIDDIERKLLFNKSFFNYVEPNMKTLMEHLHKKGKKSSTPLLR
jgi:hypothetical protein